ncbi:nitroreductase family deazaflavin-dependent oxidoreductase [Amycolatopsis azurea]|uniref:nitroreductase family deazaflavin-dependent oxidoreductase n=1 Tax=Amycolatopsis azurea TaxID=36819 RepID=UPI0037F8A448
MAVGEDVAAELDGRFGSPVKWPGKAKPGRLLQALFRAPVWLYGHGLGGLLGNRFLCLTHLGRRSGRRYRTVLEVVGIDRDLGEVMVIAGLGRASDWFRNIQAQPAREVIVGRRRFTPAHRLLTESEAIAVMAGYERRNRVLLPVLRPVLRKLLGWTYDGTDVARRRLVRQLPIVAFRPRAAVGESSGHLDVANLGG